jgi:hypothetical protein
MEDKPIAAIRQRFAVRRMLSGKTAPATSDNTGFASSVEFHLTSRLPSVSLLRITEDQLLFSPDMKKLFTLTMLISFAMICSCQKQDTEAQLAQRKTELDAREKVLGEREKELSLRETVLNERAQALAKKEKAMASAGTISPDVQSRGQVPTPPQLKASPGQPGQARDPAQLKAEREKRLQQLPPEVRALIPDASQVQAERERMMQRQLDQRQRRLEELQRTQPQMQNQSAMSPATTAAPAAVYPGASATSPSPSQTPE